MKLFFRLFLALLSFLILNPKANAKCFRFSNKKPSRLISINIIDRSGLSETICNQEKLKKFKNIDFFSSQQYQKVMRTFKSNQGLTYSLLTSYHPNGQIKQYLEIQNNRAYGKYWEWYPNGKKKIEAFIVGGIADLNPSAEASWLFHRENFAYNSQGQLVADINYEKGLLEGASTYFHDNGKIWKQQFFKNNFAEGTFSTYLKDGKLLQQENFFEGKKHGLSIRFWNDQTIAFEEKYVNGILTESEYFNIEGENINKITNGNGYKVIFGKTGITEQQTYKNGYPEGLVTIFEEDTEKKLRSFSLKQNVKEGEELVFYPNGQVKISLHWHQGILQGPVTTWYENGIKESHQERNQNKKEGTCYSWYPTGQLMLIETYDKNLLVNGEYYKLGNKNTYSKVEKGIGIASIFTESGILLKKILYQDGKPISD